MKTPWYLIIILLLTSCAASKFNPAQKYAPEALRQDYSIFRNVLEEMHPSLYWYTPKDSMDYFFTRGEAMLNDSLTETRFRYVLSYVISKMRCGHTSTRPSKAAQKFVNPAAPSLPLFIKSWPDTTVVVANINRTDSNVVRGVVLQSIDNRSMQQIIDSFFSHLSTDGHNTTHKYQTLSNGSTFRSLYANIYGLKRETPVTFLDTLGVQHTASVKLFIPPKPDSTQPRPKLPPKRERRRAELQAMRSLHVDSAKRFAVLEVNTFAKHNKLRSFFRRSFRQISDSGIQHLIVDMRGNGGGNVTLSNLLTKYIADKPFKIADSLYAIRRSSEYGKYREARIWNWLFLQLLTRKKADGNYHFTWFEKKYFKPRKANHFNGNTYILTGGNTFSAATLFTKALKGQQSVKVIGEETGGGAYGNSAWIIPDITLPNTGVRFRLPLFRLVIDKDELKGRGVIPDVEAVPTVDYIRRNVDYKKEKAIELIGAGATNR